MSLRPIVAHPEGRIPLPDDLFENLTGSASPADLLAGPLGLQINGAHRISQVNGDAAVTANNVRTSDQWKHQWSGSMALRAQRGGSNAPGYAREMLHTVTTAQASLGANDYAWFYQPIEGPRVERLLWSRSDAQGITICALLYTRTPGTYTIGVLNLATGRTYLTAVTLAFAVTTPVTIFVPPDTGGAPAAGNVESLRVFCTLAAGSGLQGPAGVWSGSTSTRGPIAVTGQVNLCASTADNILSETGWLLLPGRYAPEVAMRPLLRRHDGEEERLCQRYVRNLTLRTRGQGPHWRTILLPTPMRLGTAPARITAGSPGGGFTSSSLAFETGSTDTLAYVVEGSGDVFTSGEVWRIDDGM